MKLKKLRWPQFSNMEILLVVALFAAIWGFVAIRSPEDVPVTIIASSVLLFHLLCWKVIRANRRITK
jgi:hypothetical protein